MDGDVKAPGGGLIGNSNYILNNNCNPITDLTVIIEVDKDLVAPLGMSFQLNCYSAQHSQCVTQQYVIVFDTSNGPQPQLVWATDNWPSDDYRHTLHLPANSSLIYQQGRLLRLAGINPTLPVNYTLSIALTTDPSGNVVAVAFLVTDDQQHTTSTGQIALEGQPIHRSPTGQKAGPGDIAPIHAFELNIVGQVNGETTMVQPGGKGRVTYVATSPLTVGNTVPSCTSATTWCTEEQSNVTYGGLPEGPQNQFTQTFVAGTPLFEPNAAFAATQRFGAPTAQTDVLIVAGDGGLRVFSVVGGGGWTGPTLVGPTGLVPSGANLAAAQRIGAGGQTDAFVIGKNGQLQAFWAKATGGWNGPVPFGLANFPPGAHVAASQQFGAYNQTDVFAVDNSGQLQVYFIQNLGDWVGPQPIGKTGFAPPGAPLAAIQKTGVRRPDRPVGGRQTRPAVRLLGEGRRPMARAQQDRTHRLSRATGGQPGRQSAVRRLRADERVRGRHPGPAAGVLDSGRRLDRTTVDRQVWLHPAGRGHGGHPTVRGAEPDRRGLVRQQRPPERVLRAEQRRMAGAGANQPYRVRPARRAARRLAAVRRRQPDGPLHHQQRRPGGRLLRPVRQPLGRAGQSLSGPNGGRETENTRPSCSSRPGSGPLSRMSATGNID